MIPASRATERAAGAGSPAPPRVVWLGRQPYAGMYARLRRRARLLAEGAAPEVIWCCEHEPVYTIGRRGIARLRRPSLDAPVVPTDRGGEITYHGPGQLLLYPVLHLRRRRLAARRYVGLLERACIDLLRDLGVPARRRDGMPGVWLGDGKIAAVGLRISRGVAYHGMALNVDVDPRWFAAIDACGTGMPSVNLREHLREVPPLPALAERWAAHLLRAIHDRSDAPPRPLGRTARSLDSPHRAV